MAVMHFNPTKRQTEILLINYGSGAIGGVVTTVTNVTSS